MIEEKTIERCKELIKSKHTNWIGTSNQDAIRELLNMLKEKGRDIEKLKKIINYLQLKNIKDLGVKNYMANFINDNTPYTKDTKELENEEGIRTVDFTVKYFESKAEKK